MSIVQGADPTRESPFLDGSPQMRAIGTVIEQIADTDTTVLIRGESGVGKDLVARAIHAASSRRRGPFVKVNCAAIPQGLLESEFFGHEKGAFTGAHRRKPGQFECANQGTIYLDELGELPRALQAKLTRVSTSMSWWPPTRENCGSPEKLIEAGPCAQTLRNPSEA